MRVPSDSSIQAVSLNIQFNNFRNIEQLGDFGQIKVKSGGLERLQTLTKCWCQ